MTSSWHHRTDQFSKKIGMRFSVNWKSSLRSIMLVEPMLSNTVWSTLSDGRIRVKSDNSNFYNRDYKCTSQNFYRGGRLGCLNSGYGAARPTPAVTGGLHPLLDIAPKNRRIPQSKALRSHITLSRVWKSDPLSHIRIFGYFKSQIRISGYFIRILINTAFTCCMHPQACACWLTSGCALCLTFVIFWIDLFNIYLL